MIEHTNTDDSVRIQTRAAADHIGPSLPGYRLRRVMDYIDEHHAQPIRLVELSALVHMSPYHFARLFTRTAGMPPHQFIVRRRIDAARALLTTERLSIAVIARAVGFRTASHFTTTFRRLIGITPSAYRRAEDGRERLTLRRCDRAVHDAAARDVREPQRDADTDHEPCDDRI